MVAEEVCLSALHLYDTWKSRGGAGGLVDPTVQREPLEEEYQKSAEELLADQNCFKAIFVRCQSFIYNMTVLIQRLFVFQSVEDRKVSFELLDTDSLDASEDRNHSSDEEKMNTHGNETPSYPTQLRNVQKWSQYIKEYVSDQTSLSMEASESLKAMKPLFMMR